jgi:hypothetical protein
MALIVRLPLFASGTNKMGRKGLWQNGRKAMDFERLPSEY